MNTLLNLTNHPSAHWPKSQMSTAMAEYSEIIDLTFPHINPKSGSKELEDLAEVYVAKIQQIKPKAVHIMGEMTFTYKLVERLKALGIPCIASTTYREVILEEGRQVSIFNFVKFREY